MTLPNPKRLRDEGDFAEALRELSDCSVSRERLERNQRTIAARIGALSAAAVIGAGSAKAFAAGTVLKFALPALITGAVVVGYDRYAAPARNVPESSNTAVAPAARSKAPERTLEPQITPAAPAHESERAATIPQTAAPVPSDRAIRSDLPAELELFHRAKAAAASGQYSRALAILDDLSRRYPRTRLRAEIDVARVDYLARAGKTAQASSKTEQLLNGSAHAGRRAELLVLLGDLRVRQRDCKRAARAYGDALALGPASPLRSAAEAGLKRCGSSP